MSVDRRDVERIADLAHLRFEGEELDRLTDEMNTILEHAARLRGVEGVPGQHRASGESSGTREQPRASDPAAEAAAGSGSGTRREDAERPDRLCGELASFAPREVDGFFVVPLPPGVSAEAPSDETEADD